MLFHLRSDSLTNLTSVSLWLQGSNDLNGQHVPSPDFGGLLSFQTPRVQFVQQGLPRKLADEHGFEFASRINPDSTMAMGFVDQQTNASGPAAITTFVGNTSARLTSAQPGDYFDNGSIAHFSHVIEDSVPVLRAAPPGPQAPGRGAVHRAVPVHVPLQPARHAQRDTLGRQRRAIPRRRRAGLSSTTCSRAPRPRSSGPWTRTASSPRATPGSAPRSPVSPRIGHEAALQQVSRAADSTPLHIRADGPGLDGMDVPAFRTFPAPAGVEVPAWQQPVQAAVPHLRADRGPVRPDAHRAGRAAAAEGLPGRRDRRQRPGAAYHRDPAAELPGPAPTAPGLPAAGAGRWAVSASTRAGPGRPRPAAGPGSGPAPADPTAPGPVGPTGPGPVGPTGPAAPGPAGPGPAMAAPVAATAVTTTAAQAAGPATADPL